MERNQRETEKKRLRRRMKALREAVGKEEKAEAARRCYENIRKIPAFRESRWIYPYVSFGSELSTLALIDACLAAGKRVAVPRTEGKEIHFYEIRSREELAPGSFGVMEPAGDGGEVSEPGFLLAPGLAFDRNGGRLGYGGGFYDRYLAAHPGVTAVGICYDFQLVKEVPCETHDAKLSGIVTPEEMIQTFSDVC